MHRSVFQDTRFQPAPDQADQARITDSMFDKPEQPLMAETAEEVLQIRLAVGMSERSGFVGSFEFGKGLGHAGEAQLA